MDVNISGGGVILVIIPLFCRTLVSDWSSVSTMFIFCGLILIGYNSKMINRIGSMKLFVILGDISYDLYLWNCPILLLVLFLHKETGLQVNTYSFLAALISIHLIISYISSKFRKRMDSMLIDRLQLF